MTRLPDADRDAKIDYYIKEFRRQMDACDEIGHCPTGDAVATPAFALPARHVIHAVGPVWHGGHAGEEAALRSCYRRSLELALELGDSSIAFPLIFLYEAEFREADYAYAEYGLISLIDSDITAEERDEEMDFLRKEFGLDKMYKD